MLLRARQADVPGPPLSARALGAARGVIWPLLILLTFAVLHYAYRYVLQVSEDATSPQYRDTPAPLSVLKDAAFALFLLAVLGQVAVTRRLRRARRFRLLVQLAVALHLWALITAVARVWIGQPLVSVALSYRYLWLYSAMLPLVTLFPPWQAQRTLRVLARVLLAVLVPFWLVTVWLYLSRGRLPALSYPDNVRFGGVLDDPNGYGVLCVFLLAVLWGRARWPWLAALLVMTLATRSLSALLALLVFALVALWPSLARLGAARLARWRRSGVRLRRVPFVRLVLYSALLLLAGGGVMFALTRLGAAFARWWSAKQGSLGVHAADIPRALAQLGQRAPFELLFGAGGFSENLYLYVLLNDGVLGLVLFLGLAGLLVSAALRSRDPFAYRLGAWGVGVLAASFAIPFLQVYPLNLFFWSGLALAVYGAPAASPQAPGRHERKGPRAPKET